MILASVVKVGMRGIRNLPSYGGIELAVEFWWVSLVIMEFLLYIVYRGSNYAEAVEGCRDNSVNCYCCSCVGVAYLCRILRYG